MEYYRRITKKSICKEIFSFSYILTFYFIMTSEGFLAGNRGLEWRYLRYFEEKKGFWDLKRVFSGVI